MTSRTLPQAYQSTLCTFASAEIDASQSQAKRRPFSRLRSKEFTRRVDVISTNDSWCKWLEQLVQRTESAEYYEMKATLGEIFERNFFTEHVKSGNISMICEGNPTSGNSFSLHRGQLKLYLDRESYERSGLPGKLDQRNGNREMRSKWLITCDMRSPSMQHGKRGFDRLVYGCKSISAQPLRWLCVFASSTDKSASLNQFIHKKLTSQPTISQAVRTHQVVSPSVSNIFHQSNSSGNSGSDKEFTASELYEWLSLVRLDSPRVLVDDSTDPYISRYNAPPNCPAGQTDVKKICWKGMLSSHWVANLASELLAACPSESWVAISATAMPTGGLAGNSEFTVLKPPGQNPGYMAWDIKNSS